MQRVRELTAGNVPREMDGRGVTIAVLDTGAGVMLLPLSANVLPWEEAAVWRRKPGMRRAGEAEAGRKAKESNRQGENRSGNKL